MAGENNKVVIVTGGSSGIGRCTASALKENGCIVYEFSRRNIPMEGVTHLSVDVTDEDAVNAAVQQVIQKETKIDAVINCAGFGISGAVEFTSMEQAKAQFDVNFFGTVTVNKAVLPFLRHQGKGHIVNISSVAAVAHIPFQTFYSASKAAVSSYSYALANEVKPYGIHVTVVELAISAPDSQRHARKAFSAMMNTVDVSPGASVRWSKTSKTAWTRHALDGTSPVLWRKRTRQSFMLPVHSINS